MASSHHWSDSAQVGSAGVPEQRLLCSQDLNSTSWVLGQVQQAASMSNQPGAHQLTHQHRQVGRDGLHPALQVVEELPSVLCKCNHLRQAADVYFWLEAYHHVMVTASLQPLCLRKKPPPPG